MDHVVYLDVKAAELENLLATKKVMIIRGATGRKIPYGRVEQGDVLYFINNNAEGTIRAKADVIDVCNSEKMTGPESKTFVESYQEKLQLTEKQFERWAGKRYIVLVEVANVEAIEPFRIDKSQYSNMDDWLLVEDIENVKIKS